jgi:muconolactone delta-isomerase
MKFVVLSRIVSPEARSAYMEEQYKLVEELYQAGFFEQIYRRADGIGAVSIVEAESEAEIHERLDGLPFHVHGAIELEQIIKVRPRW